MTDTTPPPAAPVRVEQIDREFAARWTVIAPENARVIRKGGWDHHEGVQAAARHRLAASAHAGGVPSGRIVASGAMRAENDLLRKALEPFARLAGPINGEKGRPSYIEAISGRNGTDELLLSSLVGDGLRQEVLDAEDFRQARAALSAAPQPPVTDAPASGDYVLVPRLELDRVVRLTRTEPDEAHLSQSMRLLPIRQIVQNILSAAPQAADGRVREAAQRVVGEYPAAAGADSSALGGDGEPGWGSIRQLAEALADGGRS